MGGVKNFRSQANRLHLLGSSTSKSLDQMIAYSYGEI